MYYNLEKTASTLGLSTGDVNRLREKGELRAYRDGANWKFRKEDVDKYLAKMIKERSSDALLSTDSDDEQTIAATDSSAFDKMFEEGENYITLQGDGDGYTEPIGTASSENDDLALAPEEDDATDDSGLELAPADDDLALAPEDDDLVLAPEGDSVGGLSLTKEEESGGLSLTKEDESGSLTGEDSALADDLVLAPEGSEGATSKIDLTADAPAAGSGSDGDLHLGGDSGLSLMDDLGGSNVDLTDGDDLVLGGSGSSSGSGLNLDGGSGLSLLGDSDADFDIDGAVEESETPASGDEGVFDLAPDANSVLNLVKDADEDAPTELAATDESIFDLADESSVAAATETESETASLFTIDDDSQEGTGSDGLFSNSDDASASRGSDEDDNLFSLSEDTSAAGSSMSGAPDSVSSDLDLDDQDASSMDDPFANAGGSPFSENVTTSSPFESGSDSSMFGAAASDSAAWGTPTSGFGGDAGGGFTDASGEPQSYAEDPRVSGVSSAPAVSSTNFTGKDLIFLVPCLIFLILATIGALELCRTIWSYQEGIGDVGGPLLEMIAKMVKLI